MSGRIFISTGEASGDGHGAVLVRELKRRSRGLKIEGFGGDDMAAAGARVDRSLCGGAVMGLTDVIGHLGLFLSLLRKMKKRWRRNPPTALILMDFPGFNLRLGAIAHRLGIPVYYYICPQVWAWGAGRLLLMRRILARAFLILPFEEPLYQAFGIRASFVGHPLMEVAPVRAESRKRAFRRAGLDNGRPLVVLLPGSRDAEVSRHLPVFFSAAASIATRRRDLQWAIIAAPGMERGMRSAVAERFNDGKSGPRISVVTDPKCSIRSGAALAWTASGTATLELGLLAVPQIVIYRWNWFNWMIASRIVKIPHVSLVNLLLERAAVPEYLQGAASMEALAAETRRRLKGLAGLAVAARRDAAELRERLGYKERPAAAVASAVLADIGRDG